MIASWVRVSNLYLSAEPRWIGISAALQPALNAIGVSQPVRGLRHAERAYYIYMGERFFLTALALMLYFPMIDCGGARSRGFSAHACNIISW